MEAKVDNWFIPQWVKIVITIFAFSIGIILILSIFSAQQALSGISTKWVRVVSSGLVLLFASVTVAFWFFPNHRFTLFVYWLIRVFRDQIWLFGLLGIVYLVTVRIPVFSLRGGIPFINLILLFLMGLLVQPVTPGDIPFSWMKRILTFWSRLTEGINSTPRAILSVVVALLPILIICSVIYFGLSARLSDYGPYSFWNDETGYWVWIRSFSQAGFNAGYNAPNELIAQAPFNHYGEGSPFYIYFYGAVARLVGWFPALPIFINFVLLAVVLVLFIHSMKLEPVQIIWIGLITILTWPILVYLPMTTHETLNQVIGFILAIVFFRLLTRREHISVPAKIGFVFLIYVATLVRLSWGLLLVPVLFYSLDGRVFRRVVLALLLGLGLFVSAIMVTNYLVPPTNNSILLNIRGSVTEGPQILVHYISNQFRLMFKFRELNPNIAVMLQIAVIFGWSMIRLASLIRSKRSITSILESHIVFNIYTVASLAAAGLLFYIQEGFYRTFTPSLLLVYLLLAAKKDYRLLISILTINIVFFHSYMTFYAHVGDAEIIRSDYTRGFSERPQLESEIKNWIAFDETTQNPWCNTLLIPLHYYDFRLTAVPAGIGISYIEEIDSIKTPLKSKYLLFDQDSYEALADRLNVRLLESLSIGDLYYNQDSNCESSY